MYATDLPEDEEEVDPTRISATTLIYLCALCSSLTSVLLGYGKRWLHGAVKVCKTPLVFYISI